MKTNENQKSTNSQPATQKPFFGAKPEQAFFSSVREQSTPFFQRSATSKADVIGESVVQRMPAFESEVKDNGAVQRKFVNPSPIQAKLTIGEPGDKYEQEADRVASHVVEQINAPAPVQSNQGQSVQRQEEKKEELQAKPDITALQRQEDKPEELQAKFTLQRSEDIASGEASPDFTSAINSAKGGGQPLDTSLQRSMGQAMGADFSGVRVHTDGRSDALNQSVGARAFTTGQDLFFKRGEYQLGSRGGQELIAHELTHVVQQNGGVVQRKSPFSLQQYQQHPDTGDSRKEVRVQNTAQKDFVQPLWVKTAPHENRYMWDTILGAFRWYFNGEAETMSFKIEKPEDLIHDEYERLKPYENREWSFDEWIAAGWLEANIDEGDNTTVTSGGYKLKRAVDKIKQLINMRVITTDPATKGIAPKYWGEALDPAHRPVEGPGSQIDLRQRYEEEGPETHLRLNFYDWLTERKIPIGDQVKYMDEGMRAEYEITIAGTTATRASGSKPIKMDNAFVLSSDGRMYAEVKETREGKERIHHSSFMAGASVACAGKIFVRSGSEIFYVQDYSGHYQPGVAELKRLKTYLISKGGGIIELRKENGRKYKGPIQDWNEE